MRSALYYPHTSIDDQAIIKTALLLWDRLEFIVPWSGFQPQYRNREIAQAMELVGAPRSPNDTEKRQTHQHIEELISRSLPPDFYFSRELERSGGHYEVYSQKFMYETWDMLERSRLVSRHMIGHDRSMTQPIGLAIMAILADCCAGSTRSRVTDRGDAYATLAGFLKNESEKEHFTPGEEALVPITLNIIDAPSIDIRTLIAFRRREQKESGHTLRNLRHRYVDGLEKYVKNLTHTKGRASDVDEIKRQFQDDMEIDLENLKQELGFAKRDALFSKEILVTSLASIGTIAAVAFGITAPILGAMTAAGAPATVGGLLGAGNKYFSARKAILEKHPMAYLYELNRRR